MRPITLKIAAGQEINLPITGDYVRVGDSSPTCTVKNPDSGEYAVLRAADAAQFPSRFTHLAISHNEITEQTVSLDIGFGRLLTSRVAGTVTVAGTVNVAGTVQVIDGGESNTKLGNSYAFNAGIGPGTSLYSHVQLWNPAASVKNLIVTGLAAYSGVQGPGLISFYATELATALTTAPRNKDSSIAGGSAALTRSGLSSTALSQDANRLMNIGLQTYGAYQYDMREPLIVRPGWGLMLAHYSANADITMSGQFREEPI